jgi:hypothetical protein
MAKTRGTSSKGRSAADTARFNPMQQNRPPTGGKGTGNFNLADMGRGLQGLGGKAKDLISNPSLSRLNINGLVPGGFGKQGGMSPDIFFGSADSGTGAITPDNDWRVRVTAAPAGPFTFEGPMTALASDRGVVFPYTPNLQINHNANYGSVAPTHSNYPSYFYQNSAVQAITISADFTAQDISQAEYVLGMIWFFRSATKMFYGGPKSGNPPPIVYLDGYGEWHLPHVPCVVTSFSHTMPPNIDYIECIVANGPITSITDNVASGDSVPQTVSTQPQPAPEPKPVAPIQTGLATTTTANQTGVATGLATSTSTLSNQQGAVVSLTPKVETTVQSTGKTARIPTKSSISLTLQPVYSRRNISQKFNWEDFSTGNLLKGSGGFL